MTHIPVRQCIACRKKGQKGDFLRFTAGENSGRGAYLCPDPDCIRKAKKTNALGRALRVSISQELYDELLKEAEK